MVPLGAIFAIVGSGRRAVVPEAPSTVPEAPVDMFGPVCFRLCGTLEVLPGDSGGTACPLSCPLVVAPCLLELWDLMAAGRGMHYGKSANYEKYTEKCN